MSHVLGPQLKPGLSEPVTGMAQVGCLEAGYGSPRVELRILSFSWKAVGVPKYVGAGLGWASVRLGCIGERAVLARKRLGTGESL